ncbi:hypothetical protein C9374_006188 [Naegleria lovaniensis]|uniref:RGS domain-containing protein n=1 Tax=Naegleria lovaniensis TaxID=51637 RepID=A0AA88GMP6_NAELO|nr:uncharacterized protein C9374_006188 [Naegleria lovaniensis]KAG2381804.1 hypothetical protein C9374_006188 [Naegleria lovaniensis]
MGAFGGLFMYDKGCVISMPIIILVACESISYIVVTVVLLILSFRIEKDTWFIKRETLVLVVFQFSAIILFAIFGSIPIFTKFLDYYIPYGFTLLTYSFLEVILCVLMPIIYQFVLDKKQQLVMQNEKHLEETLLVQFLKNRKTFELLLDFAKRSYCPESVLCYKDIERFKSSLKHRKSISLHILKTYLKPNSPLELNVPKISQIHDEIQKVITESTPTNIPPNLFDHIQLHCLHDMTDVFERLKIHHKEARKILQEWKENIPPSISNTIVVSASEPILYSTF